MCSIVLFLIFSCYDQYERSNHSNHTKRNQFKRVKYTSKKVTNDTCAVCLEEFHSKEQIGMCKCQHGFHVMCISRWLEAKTTCPICNANVMDRHTERSSLTQTVHPPLTR